MEHMTRTPPRERWHSIGSSWDISVCAPPTAVESEWVRCATALEAKLCGARAHGADIWWQGVGVELWAPLLVETASSRFKS